jgi:hypothetical protein
MSVTSPVVCPTSNGPACASAVVRIAERASDDVWRMGTDWYPMAQELAHIVAERTALPTRTILGALAALSPQVGWAVQSSSLEPFIRAELDLPGSGSHAGFGRNREKARRIVQGAEPDAVLRGPKVRAFFAALCGDLQSVTVDRHAIAAACSWNDGQAPDNVTGLRFKRTADHYRTAARMLGSWRTCPRDLQAIVWLQWRLEKRGTLVRLPAPGLDGESS